MAAKGGKPEDFRRRRLSLTDVDTSEFGKGVGETSSPKPNARARRLSLSPEMGTKPKDNPFESTTVGTFSCHGVEPGNRQGETHAKINQDRGLTAYPFGPNKDMALFCVMDGHGANGDKVSQYAVLELEKLLAEKLENKIDPKTALTKTFEEVDVALKKNRDIDAELSGTTVIVVLYQFVSATSAKVWSACAGDSRATHGEVNPKDSKWITKDLSVDQKPDNPKEQARIVKNGGFVSPPEEEWGGPARVWLDANMTLPGLAMARSVGDHLVKTVGVIATPEVEVFDFQLNADKPQYIILASDGVWEFIESPDAFDICIKDKKNLGNSTDMVTKLIEKAAEKWRQEEGDYRDDITAICIQMNPMHVSHFKD